MALLTKQKQICSQELTINLKINNDRTVYRVTYVHSNLLNTPVKIITLFYAQRSSHQVSRLGEKHFKRITAQS